jgi:3-hydroxybutyryl-CoA dehydrogenase
MATPGDLHKLAVIGNGIIGHGIAQVFAIAAVNVRLIGRSDASLAAAVEKIEASFEQFVAHELITPAEADAALRRVAPSTNLHDAADAQLVIEAVTENLALKHELFGQLDEICSPPAILASSSGQPASMLVKKVKHRERVIATHFWYPPQLIPLVEVCAGPETAPAVTEWVLQALRAAGKESVLINREIAGFIGNRLQFAMLREAWSLWATGAASAEAIDAVVRNSFGRRLAVTGPIESADVGGLDTFDAFAAFLFPELNVSPTPPGEIHQLTQAGKRGLPSGQGVYDWSKRDGAALLLERMEELFRHLERDRTVKKIRGDSSENAGLKMS